MTLPQPRSGAARFPARGQAPHPFGAERHPDSPWQPGDDGQRTVWGL